MEKTYFHHLDAVAAAPCSRSDPLRLVTLPTSLMEGLDEVAKRRGMDRESLITQTLTSLVARELAHLDRYGKVTP